MKNSVEITKALSSNSKNLQVQYSLSSKLTGTEREMIFERERKPAFKIRNKYILKIVQIFLTEVYNINIKSVSIKI